MNYLLIGGAQSVGKSETIFRLANTLISRGFTLIAGTIPSALRSLTTSEVIMGLYVVFGRAVKKK